MLSSGDTWRRHANAWSVYTRFAAIPAMILAVWSRVWIGIWSLSAIGAVAIWLLVNPYVFRAVNVPRGWAERGVYGERLWLRRRSLVPRSDRRTLAALIAVGVTGMLLIAWGLARLLIWPTAVGATILTVAQLLRIDRMGSIYEDVSRRAGSAL